MLNQVNSLNLKKQISSLIDELTKEDIVKNFHIIPSIPDEPFIYLYSCSLKRSAENVSALGGTGVSFYSKDEAILKCLSETIERYSLLKTKSDLVIDAPQNELKNSDYDPKLIPYIKAKKMIGWVEGQDITGAKVYLPAQSVYLNHQIKENESLIGQPLSNGAAAGFDHRETLLRGIYELVERDAFLTMYLNKISPPPVRISKKSTLYELVDKIEKYHLELKIYDITNDLQIPTFLCVLIDKTGVGPASVFGMKTSFNTEYALKGAIEEAMHIRVWVRGKLVGKSYKKETLKNMTIKTHEDRMLFWAPVKQLEHLLFLFQRNPVDLKSQLPFKKASDELQTVIRLLKEKGHQIFYKDLTKPQFKQINHLTYKVCIPSLQQFYINEAAKQVNEFRLHKVAEYFKVKKSLNQIPHPFL